MVTSWAGGHITTSVNVCERPHEKMLVSQQPHMCVIVYQLQYAHRLFMAVADVCFGSRP